LSQSLLNEVKFPTFKPVGGIILPIENIYELRGVVKALGQSNSNGY
jgi:hypothetical protein